MEKAIVSAKIMDDKRSQSQQSAVSGKEVFSFIGDVKSEFKKISWTDKEELKTYTKVVVAFTFLFGILALFVDVIIQQTLAGFNGLIRLITG